MLQDSILTDSVAVIYTYTDVPAIVQGVAGEPIPYSIAANSLISSLLILSFIVTIVILSLLRGFFAERVRIFFYRQRSRSESIMSATEQRCQWIMFIVTCLMYAILYVLYTEHTVQPLPIASQNSLMGVMLALLVVFFIVKRGLTRAVNWVFFDRNQIHQYSYATLLLLAGEGVFLLPIVIIQAYFNIPFAAAMIYVLAVLILFRILTIYQQGRIFFRGKDSCLGFFIYLCTLEIAPFIVVWNVMAIISGYLT